MIAPLRFLAVAEQMGLTVAIGKWVLTTACSQIVEWQRQGLPRLSIAVNLTSLQFFDSQLLADIESILRDTAMPEGLLELEITEGMMMQNVEHTLKTLAGLKALGVRVAVDDFGIGYTTLAKLRQFPLDTIKIDRSFIRDLTQVDENRALTSAIIAMGKTLSMTVVAQGVETHEQAEFLRLHACDELQGFYFNRPVPAEDFLALLHFQADELARSPDSAVATTIDRDRD
jgi:EAL domain-containing protein (putative c-di-GMP-specific phosphodiesterase class I)